MVIIESHVLCRSKKNLKFLLYTRPPPLLTHMIKFGTLICVGMQVSVVVLIVIQTLYTNSPSRVLVASKFPEEPSVLELTPPPVTLAPLSAVVETTKKVFMFHYTSYPRVARMVLAQRWMLTGSPLNWEACETARTPPLEISAGLNCSRGTVSSREMFHCASAIW